MSKKILLTLYTMVLIATLLFVGCANPMSEAPSDVQTVTMTEDIELPAEKATSRSVDWKLVGSIAYARDIAAYENVYVISSNGKTIYEKKWESNDFLGMEVDASLFNNDPAVKIGAGEKQALNSYVVFQGVAVITESGKMYGLISGSLAQGGFKTWYEITNSPCNPKDIAVNLKGEVIVAGTDKGNGRDYVYTFNTDDWVWEAQEFNPYPIPETIIAIDSTYPGSASPVYYQGHKVLGSDDRATDIHQYWGAGNDHFIDYQTAGITPSRDIAGDKSGRNDNAFATFKKGSSTVYFIDPDTNTKKDCGSCRVISIDAYGNLWDAYTYGIYKAKLY